MPTPGVTVTKNPFALPAIPPSNDGVLAILASSQNALANIGSYADPNVLLTTAGYGPLTEYGAYDMIASGRPIVAVPSTASVTATYGTIDHSKVTGTLVPAAGATHPLEHYAVVVTFLTTGVIGVAGITYTYSLDNGNSTSSPVALGTATTLTIPNSGVSFTLTATQTVNAGDFFLCPTERALLADADVTTALNSLALSRLPWEIALIDSNFGAATVGVIDTILGGLEKKGQFKIALVNARFKLEPQPSGETEAAYATAMATVVGSQVSQRMCVGADGGHVPSSLTGLNLKRPTSMFLAAMAMALVPNIGTDPAFVGNGSLPGCQIADGNGNPFDHDEDLFPNLDGLGLVTLRSFAPGGPAGCYITNANVLSGGSNIKYIQQLRVLNKACSIAWSILSSVLSLGVRTVVNGQTGVVNIAEIDAQKIDNLVNPPLQGALQGQVTGVLFTTSRTDNLQANPPIVTAQVAVVGLSYVKGFSVTVAFAKSITAPIAA